MHEEGRGAGEHMSMKFASRGHKGSACGWAHVGRNCFPLAQGMSTYARDARGEAGCGGGARVVCNARVHEEWPGAGWYILAFVGGVCFPRSL